MLFPALQIDAPVAVAIAGAEAKDQNLGTGPKLVQKLIQRGRFGWGERPYIRRRWIPWGRACALGGAPIAPLPGAGGLPHHHRVELSLLARVVIAGSTAPHVRSRFCLRIRDILTWPGVQRRAFLFGSPRDLLANLVFDLPENVCSSHSLSAQEADSRAKTAPAPGGANYRKSNSSPSAARGMRGRRRLALALDRKELRRGHLDDFTAELDPAPIARVLHRTGMRPLCLWCSRIGARSRSRTGACDLGLHPCLPLQLLHDRADRGHCSEVTGVRKPVFSSVPHVSAPRNGRRTSPEMTANDNLMFTAHSYARPMTDTALRATGKLIQRFPTARTNLLPDGGSVHVKPWRSHEFR